MINKLKKYHKDYEQFSNSFSKMFDLIVDEKTICSLHFYSTPATIESRMADCEYSDTILYTNYSEILSFSFDIKFTIGLSIC